MPPPGTQAAAEKLLEQIKYDALHPEQVKHKFVDVADEWYAQKAPDLSEKSKDSYDYHLRVNIYPTFGGNTQIGSITAKQIDTWRLKLLKRLSDETVARAHAVLKQIFTLALQRKYIEESPMEYIKSPSINRQSQEKKRKPFTAEEVVTFLTYMADHPIYPVVRLALEGALRVGEVAGLRWSAVDFTNNTVTIIEQLQRIRKGKTSEMQFNSPKSDAGIRTFPLSDEMRQILLDHKEQQRGTENYEDLVFLHKGHSWSPDLISWTFRVHVTKSGVEYRTFHTLRNTAATLMSEGGTSIRDIQAMLGHAKPDMALRYARSTMTGKKQGVNTISKVIKGKE